MSSAIKAGAICFMVLVFAAPANAVTRRAQLVHSYGSRLALVNADGSDRSTLLARAGVAASQPDWAPDGGAVAFTGEHNRGEVVAQIYRVSADGHGLRRLTAPGANALDYSPAWRPDSRRLAYVHLRYGRRHVTSEIRTIRSEGGGTRVLHRETSGGTTIEDVTWDPDGARLLFTLGRLDGDAVDHPSLWSLAASGGRPHPLARRAQDADFSPDGDRIAFSSTADRTGKTCFEDCSFNGEIYVMDADGQAKRRLTHNRVDDVTPAWAPDGQRIAFSSDRNYETRYELFSIRPNGSCLTWLTNGTPDSSGPSWEPGARLSSDPGPCGAKSRKPLVGVPLASAHRFKRFRTWWLGKRTFSGLLLSDVFSERASLGFDYADCGFWRPVRCGAELQVDNESACGGEPHVLYGDDPRRLTRVKGALVYRLRGPDGGTDFYVGATIVSATVHKPRRVAAVANRLRRFDATSAPRRLPRAGFSRRVWRRYDRAARAVRKTGSVRRAAHALHKRPGQIRARVAMRRKLRRLGGRRLRC